MIVSAKPVAACLTVLLLLGTRIAAAADLAIVVDDLGYSLAQSERVMSLPGPVTLAILPFAPNATAIAQRAQAAGKDVILHQPMQAMVTPHAKPGADTLTLSMAPDRFLELFAEALQRVPNAIGVNNHAGSLLTQHAAPMHRLMAQISARGLFFLDSRTTHKTVALDIARTWRVPAVKRDVFLDHVPERGAIERQYRRALGIAHRQGHAVLIAHPHELSLQFLESSLPQLGDDVRLVAVRELIKPRPAALARLENPAFPRISHVQ